MENTIYTITSAISSSGNIIAVSREDHRVIIRKAKNIATLYGHFAPITCMVFSEDEKRLATASRDFSINIWDMTGYAHVTIPIPKDFTIYCMILIDKYILVGVGKTVYTLDMRGKTVDKNEYAAKVTSMIMKNGQLIVGCLDGSVYYGRQRERYTSPIKCLQISGGLLYICLGESVKAGNYLLKPESQDIYAMHVSDGWIVMGGEQGKVSVWRGNRVLFRLRPDIHIRSIYLKNCEFTFVCAFSTTRVKHTHMMLYHYIVWSLMYSKRVLDPRFILKISKALKPFEMKKIIF